MIVTSLVATPRKIRDLAAGDVFQWQGALHIVVDLGSFKNNTFISAGVVWSVNLSDGKLRNWDDIQEVLFQPTANVSLGLKED